MAEAIKRAACQYSDHKPIAIVARNLKTTPRFIYNLGKTIERGHDDVLNLDTVSESEVAHVIAKRAEVKAARAELRKLSLEGIDNGIQKKRQAG